MTRMLFIVSNPLEISFIFFFSAISDILAAPLPINVPSPSTENTLTIAPVSFCIVAILNPPVPSTSNLKFLFVLPISESSKEKNTYIDAQGNKRSRTTGEIITTQDASKTPNLYKDNIMQGGVGTKQGEAHSWWQGLANKFNSKFNMDEAMAH